MPLKHFDLYSRKKTRNKLPLPDLYYIVKTIKIFLKKYFYWDKFDLFLNKNNIKNIYENRAISLNICMKIS